MSMDSLSSTGKQLDNVINMSEEEEIATVEPKKQKLTSEVLLEFTKYKGNEGKDVAKYNHCNMESRLDLARLIIKHKYPFNMGDHEYFEIFCNGLNPNFKVPSQTTIQSDVLSVYNKEKSKLYAYLDDLSSKVTLTSDIWTSEHQKRAYVCLTVHFLNDQWELKKKIISYRSIPYSHDGDSLFRFIFDLILEWNLDKKVCAIVVDNTSNNDVMVKHLKCWLSAKGSLHLGGDLFHVSCIAHIFNLIVQDGMSGIVGILNKIRETVRYLNKTPHGKQKFDTAIAQLKLKGRKQVEMDVPNRWNSTFLMLDSALSLKEAFSRLEETDRNYKHNPSIKEWNVATIARDCLKIFYDTTRHFSGTNFPTSNVLFPDICEIHLQLREWKNSEHEYLCLMASSMLDKFAEYWDECCLVLAIAVVLDPRFKMELVEYYYVRIYGDLADYHVQRIRNAFVDLYNEYGSKLSNMHGSSGGVDDGSFSNASLVSESFHEDDRLSGFDKWYKQSRFSNIRAFQKLELDLYLEEPVFPRNQHFDILHWWKLSSAKYPTIAKMARDILAIPATVVVPESAFSIGGRVIDKTHSSLLPDVVEALVTTADWLPTKNNKVVEETLIMPSN